MTWPRAYYDMTEHIYDISKIYDMTQGKATIASIQQQPL